MRFGDPVEQRDRSTDRMQADQQCDGQEDAEKHELEHVGLDDGPRPPKDEYSTTMPIPMSTAGTVGTSRVAFTMVPIASACAPRMPRRGRPTERR